MILGFITNLLLASLNLFVARQTLHNAGAS